jgi:hypothetical protein
MIAIKVKPEPKRKLKTFRTARRVGDRFVTENGIEMVDSYHPRTGVLRTFYRESSVREGQPRVIKYLARDLIKNRQFPIGCYVEGQGMPDYEHYDNLLKKPWELKE